MWEKIFPTELPLKCHFCWQACSERWQTLLQFFDLYTSSNGRRPSRVLSAGDIRPWTLNCSVLSGSSCRLLSWTYHGVRQTLPMHLTNKCISYTYLSKLFSIDARGMSTPHHSVCAHLTKNQTAVGSVLPLNFIPASWSSRRANLLSFVSFMFFWDSLCVFNFGLSNASLQESWKYLRPTESW